MADKAKILEQAQKFLQKGNVEKAIKCFQELVETDPRDHRIRLRFADLLARANKLKDAVDQYEKTAALYIKEDFVPKAIAVYKTIVRLDPERLPALEKLANLYKSQGLEGEATAQLQQLYEIFGKQKNEEGQVRMLRRMVELDPENLGIQVRLGETLARMGKKQEAAEAFARAATTLSKRGFHERASTLFEKIVTLNPGNISVRKELCAHHLEAGHFAEARREVEAILALDPNDPRMALLLGRILFKLGEKAGAVKQISRSLELFLKSGELGGVMREFLFVAQMHLRQGELDEAEAFYHEIRRVMPEELGALKGQIAVADARRDRPAQMDLLLVYARALLEKGERKAAAEAYTKVLENDPLNEEAREFLTRPSMEAEPTQVGLSPAAPEAQLPGADETGVEEVSIEAMQQGVEELESLMEGGAEGAVTLAEEPAFEIDLGEAPGEQAEMPEMVLEEEPPPAVPEPKRPPAAPAPAVPLPPEKEKPATPADLLVEADLYLRYGLLDKALEILLGLQKTRPRDLQVLEILFKVQCQLKSPDCAVTGRDLAAALKAAGEGMRVLEVLARMREIVPASPELAELSSRYTPPPPTSPAAAPEGVDPFREDLEEADFYLTQGLEEDATRIYQHILAVAPGHPAATAGLAAIQGSPVAPAATTPAAKPVPPAPPLSQKAPAAPPKAAAPAAPAQGAFRGKLIVEDKAPEASDFLDIAEELRTELAEEFEEPQKKPEEGGITFEEIFAEFKKGIAATLGEQEYETHYNLGIAYKEMGLYDDAIRELQIASRDSKLYHDSLSLMAMCFTEKGDFSSAVKSVETALETIPADHGPGLYYQLAHIHERNHEYDEALEAYLEVKKHDPSFQGLDEDLARMSELLDKGEEEPAVKDAAFDDLFSDLIKEVGDLAEETRREAAGVPPEKPSPAGGKKSRISYI